MVSLLRKMIDERETRLLFAGMVVIAANAGGAWSPLGDVTTTMLWIGGQITALNIVKMLLLPSIVCLLVPLALLSLRSERPVSAPPKPWKELLPEPRPGEKNIVFFVGVGSVAVCSGFQDRDPFTAVYGNAALPGHFVDRYRNDPQRQR